ncbi:LysM domain protein [Acetatifactor muris]|uniref:LysM domain protein n=2 Tax=Acetatifactor muris TaxID=879566 RepID=A0A2K4ZIG7_9FIRM|nr:LysM domain protein [Acetatifactor muris]
MEKRRKKEEMKKTAGWKQVLALIFILVPASWPGEPVRAAAGTSIISQAPEEATADWNQMTEWLDNAAGNGRGENVPFAVGDTFTVPADILGRLAGKNATLVLYTDSNVTFTVSGVDVRQTDVPVCVTLSDEELLPAEALQQICGARIVRQFQMAERDEYPCLVNAHLSLGAENSGKNAVLYSCDEAAGRMKQEGIYRINESGSAMFGLKRGGVYAAVIMESYTVMPGDMLSRIAVKKGISLQALTAANPQIADPDRIHVGQILNIPGV